MKTISSQRKYYPLLDVYKFICALLLVLYHFQLMNGFYYDGEINFAFGTYDTQRVALLFMEISGFLAMDSIVRRKEAQDTNPFKYIGRKIWGLIKRFIPMVFLSTSFVYGICLIFYNQFDETLYGISIRVSAFVFSVFMSSQCGLFTSFYCVNGVTWYINVLLRCYLVFFLLQYIPKKLRYAMYIVFMGVGFLFYYNVLPSYQSIPIFGGWSGKGFASFYAGVLVYLIYRILGRKYRVAGTALLFISYGLLVYFMKLPFDNMPINVLLLFPACILGGLVTIKKGEKIYRTLGEVSYYVFFWHVPVICVFGYLLRLGHIHNYLLSYHRWIIMVISILIGWGIYSIGNCVKRKKQTA